MSDPVQSFWDTSGALTNVGQPRWLVDEALQTLMVAFEDQGHHIYAVGGCVRDTVLGRDVSDVDLSTDALPDVTTKIVEELATRKNSWKAIPTGLEHGTITAVAPDGAGTFEITTFRKDIETDGRHATVAFSKDIEDDAMRRDFTINAFYADRRGKVHDLVGGSTDLKARRVRFIGDPLKRIEEDYLRILRFFRFTASIGKRNDGIDAEGLSACALLAEGLEGVSLERIGMEMTRLIAQFDVAPIVGSMEQSGVLNRILPGASVLTLARLIDLEETYPIEGRMIPPMDVPTRLASLGCEDISDRLRLSKVDAKKLALVRAEAGSMTPPHELGYRYGYWTAVHCLLLRWASLMLPFDSSVLADVAMGANAEFPIKAQDLMPAFEGKALGDRLKQLETVWIRARFEVSKADLLATP
ncbi:CCA tRNA nucleotidyltransferase [Octadecabacter sp. 1_MG-2023]|uniref:CCA tRNA nucleotidyltransferase n=1 Tax=unclassified Octadecabacter TaxID=196158 RepID=UPI001C07FAA0|nr:MULTISPECIES: CCA tRNA nucleotidyltransferase [unclassified Octadecabacter]MBU2992294.1 CCA tRNA nucleotidyltransferase [Octadecabacter sp. B2R22]MDO6734949.1 CCA tRNA nucleotidyltransferase [Octadecabacter sp. 1_MG-2023]